MLWFAARAINCYLNSDHLAPFSFLWHLNFLVCLTSFFLFWLLRLFLASFLTLTSFLRHIEVVLVLWMQYILSSSNWNIFPSVISVLSLLFFSLHQEGFFGISTPKASTATFSITAFRDLCVSGIFFLSRHMSKLKYREWVGSNGADWERWVRDLKKTLLSEWVSKCKQF